MIVLLGYQPNEGFVGLLQHSQAATLVLGTPGIEHSEIDGLYDQYRYAPPSTSTCFPNLWATSIQRSCRMRERVILGTWALGAAMGELWDRAVSIAFLLTTQVVVVSPGTGVLYPLAAGLARGYRGRGGGRACSGTWPSQPRPCALVWPAALVEARVLQISQRSQAPALPKEHRFRLLHDVSSTNRILSTTAAGRGDKSRTRP